MEALARSLGRRLAGVEGARVEPKGLSVALHYRNAGRETFARVLLQLEQAMYEHRGRFKILRGKKVIEILPQVHWNKGECVLWIRDHLAPELPWPVLTLYVGDDWTDELAFDVLSGKAITVRVGPGRTRSAAAYRLRDVTDVHRLLSVLAAEVGEGITS
jgi:trehalose-phosphatase